MKILLGIGNRLRQDDGAGSFFAENFNADGWLSIDAGIMPENFIAVVKRNSPELLVILDAADLQLSSGSFRRIPLEFISEEYSFNTHKPPFSFLLDQLKKITKSLIYIGIQPYSIDFGDQISSEVLTGLREFKRIILDDEINSVESINL
jgi:hydrogenase 3 maturation protease